ncbi:ANTAR domain protein [Nocardioides dokdonensis FR1436]|uniref:ANTAR domain protein n=1 Tax=Nocardioides dokdonensis FR1436 TaxID=1300347 RepID=A0A1A9GFS2_9ACTN|nr:GAF and ANTAR domain-containing protein [Nocardioides dokdonensis]ANH36540.1 ANTAR domain protein [Nocardioides dokdonensis FR1436]
MTDESVDALAQAIRASDGLDEACRCLLGAALQMLQADVAGLLTWRGDGAPERFASSDDAEIAALWSHPGGPAHEVRALSGDRVVVPDLAAEERWPQWARALTDAGYRAMQVIVLPSLAHRPLALDLYARRPGAFDSNERDRAVDCVRLAALLLTMVEQVEDLRAALQSRALIAQAQGLFMERFTLTSEQAMAYLRRLSQHQQVKVRVLAQQVVDVSDARPQDEVSRP